MFGTKATVLVVTGDESVREACVEVLSDRHEVRLAADLAGATAVVESTSVDVALVSACLPDGTPSTLVDRLRDRGTVPRVALLAEESFDPDGSDPFDAVVPTPPTAFSIRTGWNR